MRIILFYFFIQMKNLAAIVLVSLCCGLLVQAETKQEAKRMGLQHPTKPRPVNIYLPGINIPAGEFNPNHRYCLCFRFKCNGE